MVTTSAIGSVTTTQGVEITPTGLSLTGSLGTVTFDGDAAVGVTGVAMTSAVGSPTEVTGSGTVDNVTGVVLTSSVGSVIIIAWNRIDTGTPLTWTKITTAA